MFCKWNQEWRAEGAPPELQHCQYPCSVYREWFPPPFTFLFSNIRKWPRTPHQWKRMCTVLWWSFPLKGFQEGVNSVVKQTCCPLNSFPEDSMLLKHYRCLYKYTQNNRSNELKFAQLKSFLWKKKVKHLIIFFLETKLGSQLHF